MIEKKIAYEFMFPCNKVSFVGDIDFPRVPVRGDVLWLNVMSPDTYEGDDILTCSTIPPVGYIKNEGDIEIFIVSQVIFDFTGGITFIELMSKEDYLLATI